nr:MAG TPA: hypothetical protein [Bacteriophage sp.]
MFKVNNFCKQLFINSYYNFKQTDNNIYNTIVLRYGLFKHFYTNNCSSFAKQYLYIRLTYST